MLRGADVPCSPIHSIDQIVNDPVVAHRQMLAAIQQPGAGRLSIAASPFRMSVTPGRVYSPAPLQGEHTIEVLRDLLEYEEDSIRILREQGVVYANEDLPGKPPGS